MSIEKIFKTILGLTERDCKILYLIANGSNNSDIASELFVSVNTVKSSITCIFRKLGVRNRAQAVYVAVKNGVF